MFGPNKLNINLKKLGDIICNPPHNLVNFKNRIGGFYFINGDNGRITIRNDLTVTIIN